MHLGSTVCEHGGRHKGIERRLQAGVAAWKKVEGIGWDRQLKKEQKGKLSEACMVPACRSCWRRSYRSLKITGREEYVQ